MTRDSLTLKSLRIAALVLGIAVAAITDPAEWGVSAVAMRWVGLAATILGTVSGSLVTSPLPGENDSRTVSRDRLSKEE